MSGSKANKIRQIVRLRQILKKWQQLAGAHKEALAAINGVSYGNLKRKNSAGNNNCPQDVPAGYLAVYVGKELKRFIIPTAYLNYPVFKALLEKAEEEFGFNHKGALTLPCDTVVFEHLTWMLAKNDETTQSMSLEQLISFYRHETECGSSEAKVMYSNQLGLGASAQKSLC